MKEDNRTIYDVAKEAGVSISTVSRVLNHPDIVSKKTRKRIENILSKYNYAPNAIARGLVINSMKTIGIAAPDFEHLPNSSVIHSLESRFFDLGYNSIICNTSYDIKKMVRYFQNLAEKKIDGLILVSSVFSESSFEPLFDTIFPNIPIIMINGVLSIPNSYSVINDNQYAMEQVISHLYDKGHRDFLFVRNAPSYNSLRKEAAFFNVLKSYGIELDKGAVFETPYTVEGGAQVVDRILSSGRPCSAIVCSDDLTAVACIRRLKELGRRIPEDIAITGYDNTMFSQLSDPALTTVDTKTKTLASIAANTLLDLIAGKEAGSPIYIQPELIVRSST